MCLLVMARGGRKGLDSSSSFSNEVSSIKFGNAHFVENNNTQTNMYYEIMARLILQVEKIQKVKASPIVKVNTILMM